MPRRRSETRPTTLLTAAAAAMALAAPALATAEPAPGFALGRFEPSFAGDRLFGVPSPGAYGSSTLHAMALLDYAHNPLVPRAKVGGTQTQAGVVEHQVLLHLDVTYALARRLAFNVDVPVAFNVGDASAAAKVNTTAASTAGIGDVRLGVRAGVFGEAEDPFQVGLSGMLYLPTGTRGAYAGDGAVRALPQLVLGGLTPWFVWSAAFGPELRAGVQSGEVLHGPSFRWSAGMGFLPGDGNFQIGPETHGAVSLVAPSQENLDADIFAGARYRFGRSFVAGFGAGLGLTHGPGTGDFRAVFSFAYTPDEPAPRTVADRDGDKIPDVVDACPDEAGAESPSPGQNGCPVVSDRDGDKIADGADACPDEPGVPDVVPKINGCPPDRDNDEIPDHLDACPEQLGVPDPDPKRNGCPPLADRDGDKIADGVDACPEVAGQPSQNPKLHGCPGDRDGDGIYDDKDACPEEKGPPDPDLAKNGCPKDVRVTDGQIVILQQVEFDTGKATIRAVSNGLLDTVANVLKEHAEILRIEVQGHTDNRGATEANTALSQARAEAVVTALAKRGINRARLTAKGFGPTRPIMSNITTLGRQKNRRVEFLILERKGKDPKDTVDETYRK